MKTTPNFRPRFKFVLDLDSQQIAERFSEYVSQNDNVSLTTSQNHFILSHRKQQRHYWSPFLDVSVEREDEKGPSLVRCLIGPAPNIWTMFMFVYGFFGFMAFVGLTLGMSQWTLKKEMWGFWLLPIALLGMAIMYFISWEGQNLAKKEMIDLKLHIDKMFNCDCFELHDEYMK